MAARATRRSASKRRSPRKPKAKDRTLNEILIDLGRQVLLEGVKEVLVDNGVDPRVKVDFALTKRKPKSRRKTASKTTRRTRR